MADDDDTPEAEGAGIAHLMERLVRLIRAQEHGAGLHPAQWEALRFLARANRFCNSPSAVTICLGATKGTVSQTLTALARRGYLTKAPRPDEPRSVVLSLTEKAVEALAADPWRALAAAAARLGGKTRRRMVNGLAELVEVKQPVRIAGCKGCRYFRDSGRKGDPLGPHLCMYFEAPLAKHETALLCVYGEERG